MAAKFYVRPVEILNGQVIFPIAAIQSVGFWSRLWDLRELCRAGRKNKLTTMPDTAGLEIATCPVTLG